MKRTRVVLNWVLVMVLVCSLVGCGKKKATAEEVYKAAYEKMNQLTDTDAEMDMVITMTAEGQSMEMGMNTDIKMEHINSENMRMDMVMEMDLLGMTMEVQSYYADGYYLMEMYGQKLKYPMSMEEAIGQASTIEKIAPEALMDLTLTETDAGRVISYQVDLPKLPAGFFGDSLSGMVGTDETSVDFKGISGTMTVNDEGYTTDMDMDMSFSMTMEGTTVECTAKVTLKYHNPGQDVTVEIPDAAEYMEIDPSMLEQ